MMITISFFQNYFCKLITSVMWKLYTVFYQVFCASLFANFTSIVSYCLGFSIFIPTTSETQGNEISVVLISIKLFHIYIWNCLQLKKIKQSMRCLSVISFLSDWLPPPGLKFFYGFQIVFFFSFVFTSDTFFGIGCNSISIDWHPYRIPSISNTNSLIFWILHFISSLC